MNVEDRIKSYWDRRSDGFSRSRRLELDSDDAAAWSDFVQNESADFFTMIEEAS